MAKIRIPAGEQGTTRVFSLSMGSVQAQALANDPPRQLEILGEETLDTKGIEIFALSDLGDLGLIGYLREGIDLDEDMLNRDRVKLAALDGWVMLLHATAFSGGSETLAPAPELTLIGSYGRTPPRPAQLDMGAKSATAYTGKPDIPAVAAPSLRARGAVVVTALTLITLAILWLVL